MSLGIVRFVYPRNRDGHFIELSHVEKEVCLKLSGQVFELIITSVESNDVILQIKNFVLKNNLRSIHFDWLHDVSSYLLEIASILKELGVSWTSTASLGRAIRTPNAQSRIDFESIKLLEKLKYLKANYSKFRIFIFDERLVIKFSKELPFLVFLPFPFESEMDSKCNYCSVNSKRPLVALVGSIFGYKGSEQLVKYWLNSKAFRLGLVGSYHDYSHSHLVRDAIKNAEKDPNNLIILKRVPMTSTLNHYLSHADAIYIDTRDYPEPSGIAERALTFGVPIIIENADSNLRDLSLSHNGFMSAEILTASFENLTTAIHAKKQSIVKSEPVRSFDVQRVMENAWKEFLE